MPVGQILEPIQIRTEAELVHQNQGPGPGGDLLLHTCRVQVEGAWVHIGKNRDRPEEQDRVGRGNVAQGGDDHLVLSIV